MKKFNLFLIFIHILFCNPSFASDNVLSWIKGWEASLPRPLAANDSIDNWWPIENGQMCRYKVIESKWDKSLAGKEFSLRIHKDKQDKSKYNFEAEDFEEFPFSAITIVDNRLFLIYRNTGKQVPFLVFPLFKGIHYYDIDYEYESLRKCIRLSSDNGYYAPVRNEFITVTKVESNLYYLRYMDARGVELGVFEKGNGLVEWVLPGKIRIKKIDNKSVHKERYSTAHLLEAGCIIIIGVMMVKKRV